MNQKNYKDYWQKKTTKQIEKELNSWEKRFRKYGRSYFWHGKDMTPPNCLAEGDKILILKEILFNRQHNDPS